MATFEQGWAARPFAEQFPQLDAATAKRLDDYNHAITTLRLGGLLTDSQSDVIRSKKMPKVVGEALSAAYLASKGGQA